MLDQLKAFDTLEWLDVLSKGKIIEVNNTLTDNPKTVNDFPYNEGWFVKIKIQNSDSSIDSELNSDCLKFIDECHDEIRKIMEKLHVRCFQRFLITRCSKLV